MFYVFEFMPVGRRLLFVGPGAASPASPASTWPGCAGARIAVSGVIGAVAGVLYAGTLGSADPSSGAQLPAPPSRRPSSARPTIQPGRFSPFGAIAAVYFLVTGITGLQLLGVETFVQQLFYGGALVLAVALAQLVRRRRAIELTPTECRTLAENSARCRPPARLTTEKSATRAPNGVEVLRALSCPCLHHALVRDAAGQGVERGQLARCRPAGRERVRGGSEPAAPASGRSPPRGRRRAGSRS